MESSQTLHDLVPEHLKPLSPFEAKLIEAALLGRVVSDFPEGPIDMAQIGEKQSVRSELLIWVLTAPDVCNNIHRKGIHLRGAKILGVLDLEDSNLEHPLRLTNCILEGKMIFNRGKYSLLDFSGSQTVSIDADSIQVQHDVLMNAGFKSKGEMSLIGANIGGNLDCSDGEFENLDGYALCGESLTTKGNVFLREGFKAKGEVRLSGANIGGNLECDGGEFDNPDGVALFGDGLTTKGDVFLRKGFKAMGEVRLPGASIGGELDCGNGEFERPEGDALIGDGLTTKGSVRLMDGFKAQGAVRLPGANIGGELYCSGGEFENLDRLALLGDNLTTQGDVTLSNGFKAKGEVRLLGANIGGDFYCGNGEFENPKGIAIAGDGLTTKGAVFLSEGFKAKGEVRLLGANIGGGLYCDGGEFENPQGDAISGDRLTTNGAVFLRGGFKAKGEVRLSGANIGGNLECDGGEFDNPDSVALFGDGLTTKGDVFLRKGFKAMGEVRLPGASIGGELDCGNGEFERPEGDALIGDGLTTKGSVRLMDGFKAQGAVRLPGANIGGDFYCSGGEFETPKGYALIGDNMELVGSFVWRRLSKKPIGILSLENANLGNLDDDENSWPESGNLYIDGLVYGRLTARVPTDSITRLRWLKLRNPNNLNVQPYEQLVSVFRQMGLRDDARKVAIAKERAIRNQLRGISRLWSWILDVTISYGYRPEKVIFLFIVPIILFGSIVFTRAYRIGVMEPTTSQEKLSSENLIFDPVAYSVDVFLPIVDLHQESVWMPNVAVKNGIYFQYYMYFHILAGWFFTTLAVFAVTGLVRSD